MTGSTSVRPTQPGAKTFSTDPVGQSSSPHRHAYAERASSDPRSDAGHVRIEPRMDNDPAFPSTSNTAYERLHGIGPDFGEVPSPARSSAWRIATMLGVFVVGAAAGLIAAWWLQLPDPASPIAAPPLDSVRGSSTLQAGDVRRATALRGISSGELPYDGAPPPDSGQPARARSSGTGISSGGDASVQRNAGSGLAADAMRRTGQDVRVEPPPVRAATTAVLEPGRADADSAAVSAKPGKQGGEAVGSVASKRGNPLKSATEQEVERMRRQAEEELKKKTEQGRASANLPSRTSLSGKSSSRKGAERSLVTREAATRAMLAKCERSANFIRRELCRWRICNGSWGRYGCPSYRQHTPSY